MAELGQSSYSCNGWVTDTYTEKPGFTKLLWQTMQILGYEDYEKPLYTWKETVTEGERKCDFSIKIPSCAAHPEWPVYSMKVTGVESFSTMEVAALHALTYLCDIHQLELGDSISRYFPVPSENNPVWGCRLRTVQDPLEAAYNPTLVASVEYMGAKYNLRQKQEEEIKTLQGIMDQTKQNQF